MKDRFLQISKDEVPRIFATGGLNIDLKHTLLEGAAYDINGKNATPDATITLGGGAANFCHALSTLNKIFGTKARIQLVTRLGIPPEDNVIAKVAHYAAHLMLDQTGVEFMDVVEGKNKIPFNSVTEHDYGRVIAKEDVGHTDKLKPGIFGDISHAAKIAQIVFIDPRKPYIGIEAARAAKDAGVPIMMDWGEKEWPEDQELAKIYDLLIRLSDILIVPSDATVKGMRNHQVNPQELFARLTQEYSKADLLMSDGNNPVRTLVDGKEEFIDVPARQGRLYALAAGDTRNAGIVASLLCGNGLRQAFLHGTTIGSIKVGYDTVRADNGFAQEILEHPELVHAMAA